MTEDLCRRIPAQAGRSLSRRRIMDSAIEDARGDSSGHLEGSRTAGGSSSRLDAKLNATRDESRPRQTSLMTFRRNYRAFLCQLKLGCRSVDVGCMVLSSGSHLHSTTELPRAWMVICQAIASNSPLILRYGGGWRILSPGVHGHTDDGVELLSGYQHDGESVCGCPTGMKTFAVAKIQRIELWDAPQIQVQQFTGHAPPAGITRIHCSA
jgi:hypothetical protein